MKKQRFLKYKTATGWSKLLLKCIKGNAITWPNGVCYTVLPIPLSQELQNHEEEHWEQYLKDSEQFGSKTVSKVWFIIKYLIQIVLKGYYHNRYEEQARDAE